MDIKIKVWGHTEGEDYRMHENCSFSCSMMPTTIDRQIIFDHTNLLYTGLKDKNGKDIYEGDIIKRMGISAISIGIVKYKNCCFVLDEIEGKDQFDYVEWPSIYFENCEIIGNKYEHNHLLDKP